MPQSLPIHNYRRIEMSDFGKALQKCFAQWTVGDIFALRDFSCRILPHRH
jgi:hypothetical protein